MPSPRINPDAFFRPACVALAGLFLLLAAAGWAMGRFGERDEEDAPPPLNIDYLKGLNFLLNEQTDQALEHFPLGEKLGQCCGGATSLLFECFVPQRFPLLLFGAGHVGRALVPLLSTLPLQTRWIDSRAAEFPPELPAGVEKRCVDEPVDEIRAAPPAGDDCRPGLSGP